MVMRRSEERAIQTRAPRLTLEELVDDDAAYAPTSGYNL
jgi:hypothetical protein